MQPPDPLSINDIRCSFIWVETVPGPLRTGTATGGFAFLTDGDAYGAAFAEALKRKPDEAGLRAPWSHVLGKQFWRWYLGNPRDFPPTNPKIAWTRLVPLRDRLPVGRIGVTGVEGARLSLDGFYFPHGVALVATATIKGASTLNQAIERTFAVRKGRVLDVPWEDGRTQPRTTLDDLANQCLRLLVKQAFGTAAPEENRFRDDPFTVWAIVSGEGIDPANMPELSKEQLRALAAVTSWRSNWQFEEPSQPAEAAVKLRKGSPGSHLVYGAPRGRAIWLPAAFARSHAGPSTISCFRRNQVFLALQIESLAGFLEAAARRQEAGAALGYVEEQCAKNAADMLGKLYGGTDDVFRSASVVPHVDQNDFATAINRIRRHSGWGELHAKVKDTQKDDDGGQ